MNNLRYIIVVEYWIKENLSRAGGIFVIKIPRQWKKSFLFYSNIPYVIEYHCLKFEGR